MRSQLVRGKYNYAYEHVCIVGGICISMCLHMCICMRVGLYTCISAYPFEYNVKVYVYVCVRMYVISLYKHIPTQSLNPEP